MKYRTDFVTNSSSTSFASALLTAIMSLLAALGLGCMDSGDGDDEPDTDGPDGWLDMAKMPPEAEKIVCGDREPVWIYAQFVKPEVDDEGGAGEPMVDLEATGRITFRDNARGWLELGTPVIIEDWIAVDVYGVEPSDVSAAPPAKVSVTAQVRVDGRTYRRSMHLEYEALPRLTVKPYEIDLLTGTGDSMDAAVEIENAGPDPWQLNLEVDSWADRIARAELTDIADDGTKATLRITEADGEDISRMRLTDYYSQGRVTVRAAGGRREISHYANVTVYREGLFVTNGLTGSPPAVVLRAQHDPQGQVQVNQFELALMRWDESQTRSVADAGLLQEALEIGPPEGQDEPTTTVLRWIGLKHEFERVRGSNLPNCVYRIWVEREVPGKPEDAFRLTLPLRVATEGGDFQFDLPVVIMPAQMDANAKWQEELEYCRRIIINYMPSEGRERKLAELERAKAYMGVDELRAFRWEAWEIARAAIMQEAKDYLDVAAWWDNAIYAAEWTVWLTDKAYNSIAGVALGPVGAYAAGLAKDSVADILVKIQENWDKSWYDIAMSIVWSRLEDATGKGIDATVFSEPEMSWKFVGSYFTYKFVWHLWFDVDESGARKGVIEALKSAAWDLAGVGLEQGLKGFVEAKAQRDGLVPITGLDDAINQRIQEIVDIVKWAIEGGAPIIPR